MKSNYKKLLYLLGLTSMLSLTACNKEAEEIESTQIVNECLENHLDKNTLQIITLSDGSKYVKDSSVFYATRERFLNNNRIFTFEPEYLNYEYYENLEKNNNYLYLLSNSEVLNHITYFIQEVHNSYSDYDEEEIINALNIYKEKENSLYLDMTYKFNNTDFGDSTYIFEITHNLADSEQIDIEYNNNKIKFNKYLYFNILGNTTYKGIEQYILTSKLNQMKIEICSEYYLNKDLILEDNYTCNKERLFAKTVAILSDGVDTLEIDISETQFEQLATLLTEAVKQNMDFEQFIEKNEKLLTEIFGEDYRVFFEINNKTYKK